MSQIITTSDLNTYARKTLDPGLSAEVVNAVNDYIEGETHRCWGETKIITDEVHNFGENLWLYQMDIQSIQSITMGWPGFMTAVLPTTAFFFNPIGRVTLLWSLYFGGSSVMSLSKLYNDYIAVAYTYGQLTVPNDLKDAALGTAMNLYNWAYNGGHEIVATSAGSYRVEMASAVRGANVGPTPWKDVAEAHYLTIKRYTKQRV
jgi:hypothetical protein